MREPQVLSPSVFTSRYVRVFLLIQIPPHPRPWKQVRAIPNPQLVHTSGCVAISRDSHLRVRIGKFGTRSGRSREDKPGINHKVTPDEKCDHHVEENYTAKHPRVGTHNPVTEIPQLVSQVQLPLCLHKRSAPGSLLKVTRDLIARY